MPGKTQSIRKAIPPDKPLGPHYKIKEAASLLGMGTKWVKMKIEEGRFDAYLFGNVIVVSLESINTYLEMCRITGQALEDARDEAGEDQSTSTGFPAP